MLKPSGIAPSNSTTPAFLADILAFRFEGYNPAYDYGTNVPHSSGRWQHRNPTGIYNRIIEDPNDRTTNPFYIFSDTAEIGGKTADTTAIVRTEHSEAAGAIDAFFHDWYHEEDLITDPADYLPEPNIHHREVAKLNRPLKARIAATDIIDPKFAVMVICNTLGLKFPSTDPYKYLDSFAIYIRDVLMTNPNYIRRKNSNRPYLGLYATASIDLTHINQFLSHFTEPLFIVICDGNTSFALSIGANAVTYYGPNDIPSGSGVTPDPDGNIHLAYSAQDAKNRTHWFQPTGLHCGTITAVQDSRPFNTNTVYVDQPTIPEFFSIVQDANIIGLTNSTHGGVYIYAHNELAEGGPGLVKTPQEKTRYYDTLRWVKGALRPVSYTYELTLSSKKWTITGSGWTRSQPNPDGWIGAHDSDEFGSANTGDLITVSHPYVMQYGLYARKGPDQGIIAIAIDGVLVQNVNLYNGVNQIHQLVWISPLMFTNTHTITFTQTGTKDPLSSSTTAWLDSVNVTFDPRKL